MTPWLEAASATGLSGDSSGTTAILKEQQLKNEPSTTRSQSTCKFLVEITWHRGTYSPESAVELVFSCESVIPAQQSSELLELAKVVQAQRPKTMLEIGSRSGGSLFVFCQMADPQATVVSIDLPAGGFGGGYAAWRVPVMHRLKQDRQKSLLLRSRPP